MQKILYIDMDNVLVDFTSAFARVQPELLREYDGRLDEVPGIFSLMDPVPHAIESFHELATKFDTYLLSTSPWENPSAWSDKLLWVKRHLDQATYKRLILTHHKNLNHGKAPSLSLPHVSTGLLHKGWGTMCHRSTGGSI